MDSRKLARVRECGDPLNANWPVAWFQTSWQCYAVFGDRVGYFPKTALAEVSGVTKKLAALPALIEAMHATESSPAFTRRATTRTLKPGRFTKYLAINRIIITALACYCDYQQNGTGKVGAK